jgi:hypothetical protein
MLVTRMVSQGVTARLAGTARRAPYDVLFWFILVPTLQRGNKTTTFRQVFGDHPIYLLTCRGPFAFCRPVKPNRQDKGLVEQSSPGLLGLGQAGNQSSCCGCQARSCCDWQNGSSSRCCSRSRPDTHGYAHFAPYPQTSGGGCRRRFSLRHPRLSI